jgi:hypothetical protein
MYKDDEIDKEEIDAMKVNFNAFLCFLNKKHPGNRSDGFVKLYMYSDGSGMILDKPLSESEDAILMEFDSPEELINYIVTPTPAEPEHLEGEI